MFNNYFEDTKANVIDYITNEYSREVLAGKLADRDTFESELNDELWIVDSVTGNGSGSYTFSAFEAKHNVMCDTETVLEALREFCVEANTIAEKFLDEDWEYFDVTARCYVLGAAINSALDEVEKSMNDGEAC